jgi:hypothetical protein
VPFHPAKQQPYKNFRAFRAFRGQKIGCGRQPTPSLFVWFVVEKLKIGMHLYSAIAQIYSGLS